MWNALGRFYLGSLCFVGILLLNGDLYIESSYQVVPTLTVAANRENKKSGERGYSYEAESCYNDYRFCFRCFSYRKNLHGPTHTFEVEGQEFEDIDSALAGTRVREDKARGTAGAVPSAA